MTIEKITKKHLKHYFLAKSIASRQGQINRRFTKSYLAESWFKGGGDRVSVKYKLKGNNLLMLESPNFNFISL